MSFLGLPRAPLNVIATVVEPNYATISWSRSPDDIKGTIRYSVDCFRCKSSKDKDCNHPCGPEVHYTPNENNITGTTVTLNGLSLDSFYLFRVYSVNELNQQEKNKDKWKYAKVFLQTKGNLITLFVPGDWKCLLCPSKSASYVQRRGYTYYDGL